MREKFLQSREDASSVLARSATALGATSVGALAAGAVAGGAVAIGALAIRPLAVKRARVQRLSIDELEVQRLRVQSLVVEDEPGGEAETIFNEKYRLGLGLFHLFGAREIGKIILEVRPADSETSLNDGERT